MEFGECASYPSEKGDAFSRLEGGIVLINYITFSSSLKASEPINGNGTTSRSRILRSITDNLAAMGMVKKLETWVSNALMEDQSLGRVEISTRARGKRSTAGGLTGGCEKWLPAVLPEVIRTLTEVYRRSRGLLRRRICFGTVNYSGYASAFVDGPHHFEPWSRDEDDT
ncbi:hypothetical protein TNCV_4413221 [Trichonephila clavipes]|nr:hypothetical protein TNCV_4413221 [Trichonephila clavipes]